MADDATLFEKDQPMPATQLAHVDQGSAEIIRTDAGSLMDVIGRLAGDPNTNVEKLERMVALYERVTDRSSKAEYSAALAEMQPELPVIGERGKISIDKGVTVQSRYALWEDINEAIRPHLAKHGFALSFRVGTATDGKITVTGILSHRSGHQEETTITLPHDSSGSKNAVQAVGSSTSYGKRYTAQALLNLTSRGEDDDGQTGGARGTSGAFQTAVATVNAFEMLGDLTAWKNQHAAGLEKLLPLPEWNELVRLVNRRFETLKAKGPA